MHATRLLLQPNRAHQAAAGGTLRQVERQGHRGKGTQAEMDVAHKRLMRRVAAVVQAALAQPTQRMFQAKVALEYRPLFLARLPFMAAAAAALEQRKARPQVQVVMAAVAQGQPQV